MCDMIRYDIICGLVLGRDAKQVRPDFRPSSFQTTHLPPHPRKTPHPPHHHPQHLEVEVAEVAVVASFVEVHQDQEMAHHPQYVHLPKK